MTMVEKVAAWQRVLPCLSMQGVQAGLATVVAAATALACGNVESKQPPRPEVGGAESGGSGNGGSASGAGGEAWVADIICPSFPGGRREGRLKYQGTNGRFEDHCDELGRLVQYTCATMVYCTPTPANPCTGDSGVAYPTGVVSPITVECPCLDGVCPPH
jgi:hypothetical protein